MITIFEKI